MLQRRTYTRRSGCKISKKFLVYGLCPRLFAVKLLRVKGFYFTTTVRGFWIAESVSSERSFHSVSERTSFLLHAEPK